MAWLALSREGGCCCEDAIDGDDDATNDGNGKEGDEQGGDFSYNCEVREQV